jgi:hypothetical protein
MLDDLFKMKSSLYAGPAFLFKIVGKDNQSMAKYIAENYI